MQPIVLKQMSNLINKIFILQNKAKIDQKGEIGLSIVINLAPYTFNIFQNTECLLSKLIPVLYLHGFCFHNLVADYPANH